MENNQQDVEKVWDRLKQMFAEGMSSEMMGDDDDQPTPLG
jgi:hypothetical protein